MEFIPGRMYERMKWGNAEFTIGKTYEAVDDNSLIDNKGRKSGGCREYFKLIEEESTVSKRLQDMDYSALEARVLAQVMREDNTYTFNVSSGDAIDHQEIMETLTKKRPVAIVKRDDGMHTVIIHDSLWNKVAHMDRVLRKKLFAAMDAYLPTGYLPLSSKHLGVVLGLLRELRTAPYVNRKKLTVSVETLEI